jgi:heme exporter protein D
MSVDSYGNEKKKSGWVWIAVAAVVVAIVILFILSGQKEQAVQEEVQEQPDEQATPQQTEPVKPSPPKTALTDTECGDGVCSLQEIYEVCQVDCIETCGDGIVQDDENWKNCRYDIMSKCGDKVCDEWEHYRYCRDCKPCVVSDTGSYDGPDKCPPSPRWVN